MDDSDQPRLEFRQTTEIYLHATVLWRALDGRNVRLDVAMNVSLGVSLALQVWERLHSANDAVSR